MDSPGGRYPTTPTQENTRHHQRGNRNKTGRGGEKEKELKQKAPLVLRYDPSSTGYRPQLKATLNKVLNEQKAVPKKDK